MSELMPWNTIELKGWDIVGMNHYRQAGQRRLFVAMTKSGRCITAEGDDEKAVWTYLRYQAEALKLTLERERIA